MQIESKNKAFNNPLVRLLDLERPHTLIKTARIIALLKFQKEPPNLRYRFPHDWENSVRTEEL